MVSYLVRLYFYKKHCNIFCLLMETRHVYETRCTYENEPGALCGLLS